MPEISIIIPVYNAQKYIKKCLDSLIGQTYDDIEIICINDGSSDDSLKILQEYSNKDKRVIIINQRNQGCAISRNNGLKKAKGKFIMFCDSDDFYDFKMCEKLLKAVSTSGASYALCGTNVIYKDRQDMKSWDDNYFKISYSGVKKVDSEYKSSMNNGVLWNRIWRKSIIDKYGIKFPVQPLFDDIIFCKEYLFVSDKVYLVSEKLYNYVRLPNSFISNISARINKDVLCVLNSLEFFYAFLSENDLYHKNSSEFWSVFINLYQSYYDARLTKRNKSKISDCTSAFIRKFDINSLKEDLPEADFAILMRIIDKKYFAVDDFGYKVRKSVVYFYRYFSGMI